MKTYIIYKSEDKQIVLDKIKELQSQCPSLEALILESVPLKLWKYYANKKIKQADCALFFVGKNSHTSKYIDWEIKQFIKNDKRIYTIKLNSENVYNKPLYRKDVFGNVESVEKSKFTYSKEVTIEKLCEIFADNMEMNIEREVTCNANMSEESMIEQYKAYLQTSEELVARRQSVSNFYITVNSALITILSAIVTIVNTVGSQYASIFTVLSGYITSLLGIILCFNWKRIVFSYGQLNAAKMKVISAIEKKLPFNIYDTEWKVQTDKLGKRKYISFTNIEKTVPFLFIVLYTVVLIASIVLTFVLF